MFGRDRFEEYRNTLDVCNQEDVQGRLLDKYVSVPFIDTIVIDGCHSCQVQGHEYLCYKLFVEACYLVTILDSLRHVRIAGFRDASSLNILFQAAKRLLGHHNSIDTAKIPDIIVTSHACAQRTANDFDQPTWIDFVKAYTGTGPTFSPELSSKETALN